jgi:hypothetical protein
LKPLPPERTTNKFSILLIILYWDCKLTILQHHEFLNPLRDINCTRPNLIDSFLIQKFPSTHQNHRFEYELQSYNPYSTTVTLELVLLSVLKQSKLPQEIIIGDDGSSQETAALVESFKIDLVFL